MVHDRMCVRAAALVSDYWTSAPHVHHEWMLSCRPAKEGRARHERNCMQLLLGAEESATIIILNVGPCTILTG